MKIISVSWIGNEADIIASFVRYHCQLLDRMILVCRRDPAGPSDDGTLATLQSLQREGLPIEVRCRRTALHDQALVLSALLREVQERFDPAWILPLDADEFLVSHNDTLSEVLASLPQDRVTLLPWRTYVPLLHELDTGRDILTRIQHRRTSEDPPFTKVLIPALLLRERTARLTVGSHTLLDGSTNQPFSTERTEQLHLAHFPVRSPQQLRQKVVGGWRCWLPHPERREGEAEHWRALALQMCTADSSPEETHRIALRYALRCDAPDPALLLDPVRLPRRDMFVGPI